MVRCLLSPILLFHLLLLDLVEPEVNTIKLELNFNQILPAEYLVFKLLIHGVHKAGLVQLKLEGFLEELCLWRILLEDRRHQLQHVRF